MLAILAGLGAFVVSHYLQYARSASAERRENVLPAAPPARVLSLEERAAAAQGTRYPEQRPDPSPPDAADRPAAPHSYAPAEPAGRFNCDGRERCPQMHSCDEATWFLRNCPNTKMDGDHDGIPCEDQWCRGRS